MKKTSALYTDLSLITANQEIGKEAAEVFAALLKGKLLRNQSSSGLREMSAEQSSGYDTGRNRPGETGKGYILESRSIPLTDKVIINKLVEASQAGVKIEMVVRGICCLIPEIKGYTKNIKVVSIVGRYLGIPESTVFGTKRKRKNIYCIC